MPKARPANLVPAPLIALACWLVPGSGYWLIGQRARALAVGITIIILFILGLLIGGIKVVDAPASFSSPFRAVMDKPWFVGQVLAGPICLVSASMAQSKDFMALASHARINDIGTLYTAIAGMLNLLAIIDASYRAFHLEREP